MKETRFGRLVFIPGSNGSRYPFCNSLYIDEERKVIIDPACDESLLRRLGEEKGINAVINSHFHEDHTAFNYLFPDADLYVHEDAAPGFKSYETFLDCCGLSDTKHKKEWDDLYLNRYHFQERTPAATFKDGETISFGRTRATVIHTPGHTVGHCSFHFPDLGILFLVDYDLSRFGPWYGDQVSDIDQTIESVRRLLAIPADIYITSHDMGIIKGDIGRLADDYLRVIDRRDERLLKFLEAPRTLDEIVNRWIIFRKAWEPLYFYELAERMMIGKHLDRLIARGLVALAGGKYSLV